MRCQYCQLRPDDNNDDNNDDNDDNDDDNDCGSDKNDKYCDNDDSEVFKFNNNDDNSTTTMTYLKGLDIQNVPGPYTTIISHSIFKSYNNIDREISTLSIKLSINFDQTIISNFLHSI